MHVTWTITFTDPEGQTQTTDIQWSNLEPTKNEAAVAIRDRLLGDVVFARDRPRESQAHTLDLLAHHNFVITGIEKAQT